MGSFSIWHWLIVLAVILIVFGAGKLPRVMGDVAKGIKNFKAGMQDEEKPEEIPPQTAASSAQPQPAKPDPQRVETKAS